MDYLNRKEVKTKIDDRVVTDAEIKAQAHAYVQLIDRMFKALADPRRMAIIALLSKGEICACKIHEPIGLSQNLASHHLRVLTEASLIKKRKVGRNIFYSVREDGIEMLQEFLGHLKKPGRHE
jgi:ArsR family transcriptional regulator